MTPGGLSRKRKRNQLDDYSEATAKYEYTSTSSATGNVEVKEADGEGKFIKLINNSADEVGDCKIIGMWDCLWQVNYEQLIIV